MQMKATGFTFWIAIAACLISGFSLLSCGGGGTSASAPPPQPQNISVTVNPPSGFSGNLRVTQTVQFSATVSGTTNQAVTWAVNGIAGGNSANGTVSVSGLYTAPNQVPTSQNVTVTATSQADASKSGAATLTIIPPRSISSLQVCNSSGTLCLPGVVALDANTVTAATFTITVTVNSADSTDSIKITPSLFIQNQHFTSATQMLVTITIPTASQSAGEFSFQLCDSNGLNCSGAADLILAPNQNALAVAPSGALSLLDLGGFAKFDATGSPAGSCSIGSGSGGVLTIAADGSGNPVIQGTTYDPAACTANGSVQDDGNGAAMGTAAKTNTACLARQNANMLSCFTAAQFNAVMRSTASSGVEPWLVEMPDATQVIGYYRESAELRWYSTASMTLQGTALHLTGITPKSQLPTGTGFWRLALFHSGPAAGTGAFLSQMDKVLIFFDVATMSELRRVTLSGPSPINLAADETNGTAIIARADKTLIRVDVSTATPTTLISVSTVPAMGLRVSSDGTKIFAGRRGHLDVLTNH